MVLLSVYAKNLKIKYKSTLFSKATFLVLLSELFAIIFSFIIAYNTGGLWLKTASFYEQPTVDLVGDYILTAKTSNATPIVCSTYLFYRQHLPHYDFCSIIKFREIDYNYDGKNDELTMEINFNLYNYTLDSINLVLPIKYQLKDPCTLKMQSFIIYQYNFQREKVTELIIYASLEFVQSSPISCRPKLSDIYNVPIIENGPESKNYALESILEKYLQRNVTTHLKNVYTVVKTGIQKSFTLKLLVKYPKQQIYYRPGFWQIIKMAWIQYFAIYIILSWLARKIKDYIFHNRLVWYYADSPLNKK
ncbi:unnamed protein product [Phyllotreta striolata]|uniref:Transmembrane protein 231 n=1 Tax=Phyllotreta striolata TaxID=444603 RepID=A0A9N9THD2_PHYSR|nr:unnamed protein product [Phyllotreta striolata]